MWRCKNDWNVGWSRCNGVVDPWDTKAYRVLKIIKSSWMRDK